jgi:hypothetical protein
MNIVNRCSALARILVAAAAGGLLMWAIAGPAVAQGNSNKLKFSGGIGAIPVSSVSCVPSATPCVMPPATSLTVTQNTVRGQAPAGQIWVLNKLDATVNANGSINVSGNMVLGGGNTAGTAPAAALFATLSCSSTSPFSLFSTPIPGTLPTLSPNGDFQINAVLSGPSGPPTLTSCAQPLLLIQSQTNNHWFALGFVK